MAIIKPSRLDLAPSAWAVATETCERFFDNWPDALAYRNEVISSGGTARLVAQMPKAVNVAAAAV